MAPFVITLKHFLAYSDQLSMFAVSLKDPVSNPKVKPSAVCHQRKKGTHSFKFLTQAGLSPAIIFFNNWPPLNQNVQFD